MTCPRSVRLLITALSLAWLAGQGDAADLPVLAWQGRTMGSPYTVKVVDPKLDAAAVAALKKEIEDTLVEVNRQMSNWQADSALSCFNRAEAKVPFPVSPAFAKVMRFALDLSRRSEGAFDPTLGPLINLWGFGEQGQPKRVPDPGTLRETVAKTGWKHLALRAGDKEGTFLLEKDLPGLALDLGAVAKGFGVDEMIRVLRGHGFENVYASIAGEVRVLGHNPRGTKWVLGVSVPVDQWRENDPMAAMVNISNQALSTSGDYQKFFLDEHGRRLCHIIDPRTGTPVQHMLAGVTVVAPDSMTADGYSTTSFVLGPEEGMKFIESRPDAAALFIVRDKDGGFRQSASSRFAALTGHRAAP